MPEKKEPVLERPAPEKAKPPILTFRILFLDSAENVELLKTTCKEEGYVVVGATTIEEALAFLHGKNHADVIVAAAYLEDESVFKFLREVRESEQHREVMFLILSLDPSAPCRREQSPRRSRALRRLRPCAGESLGESGSFRRGRTAPGPRCWTARQSGRRSCSEPTGI